MLGGMSAPCGSIDGAVGAVWWAGVEAPVPLPTLLGDMILGDMTGTSCAGEFGLRWSDFGPIGTRIPWVVAVELFLDPGGVGIDAGLRVAPYCAEGKSWCKRA